MRVLFVCEGTTWSGGARVFASAARGLASRGWETRVACIQSGAIHARLLRMGVDSVTLPAHGRWVRASGRLVDAMRRGVDAVFVHTDAEHVHAAVASRRAGRGAVVRRLGAGAGFTATGSVRLAMRLAHTVFLDSSPDQAALTADLDAPSLAADLGVDVERVVSAAQAELPVDDVELTDGHVSERRLVCVCDPSSHARAFVVLRAVAMLAPRHPELRLVLVGPGVLDSQLRMHAAALGIHRVVECRVGDGEVTPSLADSALGWVVADGDDGALGALDFMAAGVPVFAERGSIAARYVADNITGRHLDAGDVPGTAAALAALLARHDDRVAMGNAGRARAQRAYGEAAMLDGFARAAAAAVERGRRAAR